jgi:hypothetical protein
MCDQFLNSADQKILKIKIEKSLKGENENITFSLTSSADEDPKVYNVENNKLLGIIDQLSSQDILLDVTITQKVERNEKTVSMLKNKISDKQGLTLKAFMTKLSEKGVAKINLQDMKNLALVETVLLDMRQYYPTDYVDVQNDIRYKDLISKAASELSAKDLEVAIGFGLDIDQETLDNSLFGALGSKIDVPKKVELLLEYRADPNKTFYFNDNNETQIIKPLYIALNAKNDSLELTKLLLSYGAEPNKVCFITNNIENANTIVQYHPLYLALISQENSLELTQLLVQYRASVDVLCYYERCSFKYDDFTKVLSELSIKPLYMALTVPKNSFNLTKFLVENCKADVSTVCYSLTEVSSSSIEKKPVELLTYDLHGKKILYLDFLKQAAILRNAGAKFPPDIDLQRQTKDLCLDYEVVPKFFLHEYIWEQMKFVVSNVKKLFGKESGEGDLNEPKIQILPDNSNTPASQPSTLPGILQITAQGEGDKDKTEEADDGLNKPVPAEQPKASGLSKVFSFAWWKSCWSSKGSAQSKDTASVVQETKNEDPETPADPITAESLTQKLEPTPEPTKASWFSGISEFFGNIGNKVLSLVGLGSEAKHNGQGENNDDNVFPVPEANPVDTLTVPDPLANSDQKMPGPSSIDIYSQSEEFVCLFKESDNSLVGDSTMKLLGNHSSDSPA